MLTTVKKSSGLLLSLLLLISASSPALAQRGSVTPSKTLPAYYPASYQKSGIIRELGSHNTVIISGLKYKLAASAKIHTESKEFASSWVLKSGDEVGFSYSLDASNNKILDEIWVLPKGSVKLR